MMASDRPKHVVS